MAISSNKTARPEMGKERGELASRFAAGTGHERNKFAVESCFANQQTRRNRDAHPAVLQDIDVKLARPEASSPSMRRS